MAKQNYTMKQIIDARQTVGTAYDKAKNLKNPDDKLTVLKMGYYYACQEVPDPTKRTEYWYLLDIDKYQNALISKMIKNNDRLKPNQKLNQVLRKRLNDVNVFTKDVVRNETTRYYADFLFVVNKHYEPVYPDPAQFAVYIQPYQDFLQKKYLQNKKQFNFK